MSLYPNFSDDSMSFTIKSVLNASLNKVVEKESRQSSAIYESTVSKFQSNIFMTMINGKAINNLNPLSPFCKTGLISWNSTGLSCAISFGNNQTNGWSCQSGYVIVWTTLPTGVHTTMQLDYNTSILCCNFHPVLPTLLACGAVNGEIIVSDLNHPNDDSIILNHTSGSIAQIIQVRWIKSSTVDQTEPWLLYCGAADGTLIVWSIKTKSLVTAIYQITSGLCCFDIGSDMFIGRANGFIKKAKSADILKPFKNNSTKYSDDVNFRGHIGPVNSVSVSTFKCNIFASAGNDGSVQIFHSSRRSAIRRWESAEGLSLTCIEFSPHRPSLLAVSSSNGLLYFFDLRLDAFVPIFALNIYNQVPVGSQDTFTVHRRGVGIRSFSFNPRVHDSVAICDNEGGFSVWKLSMDISSNTNNKGLQDEINQLNKLC